MAFKTKADIVNGEYGTWSYDEDGNPTVFTPLGKAVTIEFITENIDTDRANARLLLSFDYLGRKKYFEIPRKALTDHTLFQELADAGADVTKKHFNVFVDTLRQQELEIEATGVGSKKVYSRLGWKTLTILLPTGGSVNKLCYRAHSLVGPYHAVYDGSLKITPMGTFDAWKDMVENEIIGHPPAEVVMLAGLSAVVNGLLSTKTTGENPIIHLNGHSSTGKSAIAIAAASAYGEPFDGSRNVTDSYGITKTLQSCYGSWSATENATLGRCSGNRGFLIVLNELGKYRGGGNGATCDMSSIVYSMSEGTDKLRMNQDYSVSQLEGFTTTILSVGERSLLDKCKDKADGLRVRVLELDMPMTTSAENADKIKAVSRKNNGWAAPMMAEYIINNGGLPMVEKIYRRWHKDLLNIWPDTPMKERFVEKFPTLFLTTAELAEAALGIKFSVQAILDFFLDREKQCGGDRNLALNSYNIIKAICMSNTHKFHIRRDKSFTGNKTRQDDITFPNNECWGRITYKVKPFNNTRIIVAEIELLTKVAGDLLRENGFENIKTCVNAWQEADLLQTDDGTHKILQRKIDPSTPKGTKEDVYVLRVFCSPDEVDEHLADLKKQQEQHDKVQRKIVSMHSKLLTPDEDEEVDADGSEDAHSA